MPDHCIIEDACNRVQQQITGQLDRKWRDGMDFGWRDGVDCAMASVAFVALCGVVVAWVVR
jgi:hypothetical protein